MTKFVIHDTADVVIRHKASGKIVLNAEAQLASISGTISEEDLRGGIGNKKLYKIRTDKDINLTIRSAFGDMEYWAMTQGVTVEKNGTAKVTKVEKIKVTGTASAKEIAVPTNAENVVFHDNKGVQFEVTPTAGKITVPTLADLNKDDVATVFYKKAVTGNKISILSDKFAEKYQIEYRTISYNPETAEVYSDIYFLFPDVLPVGEFEISLENGSAYTPEINFSVMTETNSSLYAEIIEEVRP